MFPNVRIVGTTNSPIVFKSTSVYQFQSDSVFTLYLSGNIFHLIAFSCVFPNNAISTSLDTVQEIYL